MDTTANDNEPLDRFPRGDAVGFRALLLEQQRKAKAEDQSSFVLDLSSEIRHSHISLIIALMFWSAATLSFLWSYYTGQSVGLRIFTGMATVWTALWSAYLAKHLNKPRLGELTILTALMGFIGMLLTASTQLGFPLQTGGGICLLAIASWLVAALTYSRVALMTSISSVLAWAALHFDGYLAPSLALILLPLLIAAQILLGAKFRSRTAMFAAVMVTYVWLLGFAMAQFAAGALSPLYFAAGIFLIGGVHLQISKAADDEGFDSTPIHILFAWCLMITGLVGIQHYSLFPGHELWAANVQTAALHKLGWGALMAMCLGLITLAALVRRRHGQMTWLTVALLTILYALIPLCVWFEAYLTDVFLLQTGSHPHPAFGLFLGGVILAMCLTFVINNIRRNRYILSAVGLGMMAFQGNLSLRGDVLQNGENLLIVTLGMLLGVAVFTVLKHAQFDPYAPQQRLQRFGEA